MAKKSIFISPDGRQVATLAPDDFDFKELSDKVTIKRASNVEPTEDGKWQADMSPVGGGKLPEKDKRRDALKEEVDYLEDRFRQGDFMDK